MDILGQLYQGRKEFNQLIFNCLKIRQLVHLEVRICLFSNEFFILDLS